MWVKEWSNMVYIYVEDVERMVTYHEGSFWVEMERLVSAWFGFFKSSVTCNFICIE